MPGSGYVRQKLSTSTFICYSQKSIYEVSKFLNGLSITATSLLRSWNKKLSVCATCAIRHVMTKFHDGASIKVASMQKIRVLETVNWTPAIVCDFKKMLTALSSASMKHMHVWEIAPKMLLLHPATLMWWISAWSCGNDHISLLNLHKIDLSNAF